MTLATLSPAGLQFWHSIVLIAIVALFTLTGAVISALRMRLLTKKTMKIGAARQLFSKTHGQFEENY